MRWFEKNVIAPIDRGLAWVEAWYDAAPGWKKALGFFGVVLVLVVVVEASKAILN